MHSRLLPAYLCTDLCAWTKLELSIDLYRSRSIPALVQCKSDTPFINRCVVFRDFPRPLIQSSLLIYSCVYSNDIIN